MVSFFLGEDFFRRLFTRLHLWLNHCDSFRILTGIFSGFHYFFSGFPTKIPSVFSSGIFFNKSSPSLISPGFFDNWPKVSIRASYWDSSRNSFKDLFRIFLELSNCFFFISPGILSEFHPRFLCFFENPSIKNVFQNLFIDFTRDAFKSSPGIYLEISPVLPQKFRQRFLQEFLHKFHPILFCISTGVFPGNTSAVSPGIGSGFFLEFLH